LNEMASNGIGTVVAPRLGWQVFGMLMTGALVRSLAVLSYYFTLVEAPPSLPVPLWLLLIIGTVQSLVLFAVVIGLGLWLGGKVGLGAPVLRSWLAGDPEAPRCFRGSLPLVTCAGAAVGVVILLLELVVFVPLLSDALRTVSPPAWQGFLAAFHGGINEELLLRLGMMTLLVWVRARLTRKEQPGPGVVWTANVLAALLFGAGHLPTVAALAPLTTVVVARALLLNTVAGVLFGWLYWRRGMLAAIVAHFSADIVLHVVGMM